MKSTLSVAATLMIIGQTKALSNWEQMTQALSTFNVSKAMEHAQNIDFSQYVTTRHDSKRTIEAEKRRMPRLNKE